MGGYIRLAAGEAVRVGSRTLPGVITSVSVQGSLSVDEQNLENTDLKTLAVQGFTTQKVTVNLVVVGETQGDVDRQVGQIQTAFQVDRVKDAGAKLVPVRIVSSHLDARRVKLVVFDDFTSTETDDLEVTCVLGFHEFEADVARMQERVEQEQRRREKEAEAKAKKGKGDGKDDGKGDGKGKGTGGAGGANGPNGVATPPGPGAVPGGAGGSGTTTKGGPPPMLQGFNDGSAVARSLLGR